MRCRRAWWQNSISRSLPSLDRELPISTTRSVSRAGRRFAAIDENGIRNRLISRLTLFRRRHRSDVVSPIARIKCRRVTASGTTRAREIERRKLRARAPRAYRDKF
jgi:hypothetical protein